MQIPNQNYQNHQQNDLQSYIPLHHFIQPSTKNSNIKSGHHQHPDVYQRYQRQDKSMKNNPDRFVPIRNLTQSARQFYSYHKEWNMEDQNHDSNRSKGVKSSVALSDVYKMSVLGENNCGKDMPMRTFTNGNFLKYKYQSPVKTCLKSLAPSPLFSFPQSYLSCSLPSNRKISPHPIKVLQAPSLLDDYYLNLLDWSSTNILSVCLRNNLYLWNGNNSSVSQLCQNQQTITSCSFSPSTNIIAIGNKKGQLQLWDYHRQKKIQKLFGHTQRIGSIAWQSTNLIVTGSRDKSVLVRDVRCSGSIVAKMINHKQEVCGLKWSYDGQTLASGGNDNKINIWNLHQMSIPVYSLTKHNAAVKAMSWSPFQYNMLVTGGGTDDQTIRFWNTNQGNQIKSIHVGSQVCNIFYSHSVNQLISSHGYSHNQINIWNGQNMNKIQTLNGHTSRVVYMAMSPDASVVVTGAGDETLRFWNVFPKKQQDKNNKSLLRCEDSYLR